MNPLENHPLFPECEAIRFAFENPETVLSPIVDTPLVSGVPVPLKKSSLLRKKETPAPVPELPAMEDILKEIDKRPKIKHLGASMYKINAVVGRIVQYDREQGDYVLYSLFRPLLDDYEPEVELIDPEKGLLYSSSEYKDVKVNFLASLFGLKVEASNLLEISVRDDIHSYIDDKRISKERLQRVIDNLPAGTEDDFFLVTSVLTTSIEYRLFRQSKFEQKVDATYITVGGSVYQSKENLSRKRQFSIEIVPLKHLLIF